MVEFALLLPILLVLLLALVQVGVLAKDRLLLSAASRAGVREAAIVDSETAARDAAVRAAPGLDPSRLGFTIERTGLRGGPVTVSLSYDIPVSGLLAGWLLPPVVTLESSATARQEYG